MATLRRRLADIADGGSFDLAVLGAGAGGMAAAVFAALNGQRVLLVERTEYLGGTSALSAATTWVPGTRLAATVGAEDSRDKVSGFLDRAVGNRAPKALREAFLDAGPRRSTRCSTGPRCSSAPAPSIPTTSTSSKAPPPAAARSSPSPSTVAPSAPTWRWSARRSRSSPSSAA